MGTEVTSSWRPCEVVLSDGTMVHLRPIEPADAPALEQFHDRLSDRSVYLRFFTLHRHLSKAEVQRFTNVDGSHRMALVATAQGQLVAVGRYDRDERDPEEAETALVVADAYQGRGLGTLLLEHLASYARGQGIRRFVADTLAENLAMQRVFRDAGFTEVVRFKDGVVNVRLDLEPNESAVGAIEGRWAGAAARSIARVLEPKSVAVVGAGRSRGGIGHEIVRNIVNGGFEGPVYPVNPTAPSVASVPAYGSVLDIARPVDLAVIAVPHDQVTSVVDDCAAKGVRALVVVSAGFAETGERGRNLQDEVLRKARHAGMRVVGPNCLGIINTSPGVSLNATFAPVAPAPGHVAFSSQSGALGIAVLEEAHRRKIGLSSFVSVGNKCDVSGNDLLQYWREDPATDVILLYLESFGNPRRFARVARSVSRQKPIIAVKAGRTPAGHRAASSHTAALASGDVAVDALFQQAGVIRVDTLEEMFDLAQLMAAQPPPAGRRVAIVGNAGGAGILAADACEAAGLVVPELSGSTHEVLRTLLPAEAGITNPVDMVASASPDHYLRVVRAILSDRTIDSVLTIFVPPTVTDTDAVAAAISRAASRSRKTVLATFLGVDQAPAALSAGRRTVPCYRFPEPAVRALARSCMYGEWRARPVGAELPVQPSVADRGRAMIDGLLRDRPDGGWMDPLQASDLLELYGIPSATSRLARSSADAIKFATEIGYPVALKAVGPDLVHKSDVGGVLLGIGSEAQVEEAYREIEGRLGPRMEGVMVQEMLDDAVECVVGIVQDPAFGPLLMFGSGGTTVELFGDQAFRTLPITDVDAAELVRSTRGSPLLFGYRGRPRADTAELERVLMRVGQLAGDLSHVLEADINPLMVGPHGAVAVDARIRVGPAPSSPDPALRKL